MLFFCIFSLYNIHLIQIYILANQIYTRGLRAQGVADPLFEEFLQRNFPFTPPRVRSPLQRVVSYPPHSQRSPLPSVWSVYHRRPVQVPVVQPVMATPPIGPWGNAFGPLCLAAPLHELPRVSRKHLPKFQGDGKQHPDEHITAFYIIFGILGIEHEDVSIRLFIESLQGVAAKWFFTLPNASITDWASLRTKFEEIFNPTEDSHALLAQLTTMRKEAHEPMREFVEKFNKLVTQIPNDVRPTDHNLKCFLINTQLPKVSFYLCRENLVNVEAAQQLATSLEDDISLLEKSGWGLTEIKGCNP